MGFGEAFGPRRRGDGWHHVPLEIEDGEVEIAREAATFRPGRLNSVNGDLILTDRRLVFAPLDPRDAVAVPGWTSAALRAVTAGTVPTFLRPPTLIVTDRRGARTEIAVLAGRGHPNGSPANTLARDRMITAIQARLG